MYKKLVLLLISVMGWAQVGVDVAPVFPSCETENPSGYRVCLEQKVSELLQNNFKLPSTLKDFSGNITTLYEVDAQGKFNVLYIDAPYLELKEEILRVFALLPVIKSATYNGEATYSKHIANIRFPLQTATDSLKGEIVSVPIAAKPLAPELLPFSHQNYAIFDGTMHAINYNGHSAFKPLLATEINFDTQAFNHALYFPKKSWWGRKFWNESLVQLHTPDYSLTLNPIVDFRLGKDTDSSLEYTYINTRGVSVAGTIGKQVSFVTSLYESQARFADYYNQIAENLKPSGGNPALIPGVGIAKSFKTDAYDFPMAEANVSYTPSKYFNFQIGYGRNFIGDGYRSLLLGDAVSPYPYFKIHTTFGKIKYTNLYTSMKDIRYDAIAEKTYGSKYTASHYLSINIGKRLNVGLFESVIWTNTNNRGFDANFIVPIIFYRSVEFNSSSKTGNAILGATAQYKLSDKAYVYGQFILDEFSIADVKAANKSWKNKFGYQWGIKYSDAFKIKNLGLQWETNIVRPYVYSHSNPLTNYGHNNQSLGHPWGANFWETIGIARYQHNRWYAEGKAIVGQRGLDINNLNYGGNIYLSYDETRANDTQVTIAQGNKVTHIKTELQVGYWVNPSTRTKAFVHLLYRSYKPTETVTGLVTESTWVSVGIRSDLFNWYLDY